MKIALHLFIFSILLIPSHILAQTSINGSFMYGGIARDYILYIPSMYNTSSKPVPLVLNLHGYTSNNQVQEVYGDFRPIADTANFLIVHPNGTMDNTNNRYWNMFGLPQPDDVGFLNTLLDTLIKNYVIDTNRIYSTGMSNGGFMSYELACKLSPRIAAIASVAGSMIDVQQNTCTPSHPMPVMQIHGTADQTVSYTGVGGIIASKHIDSLIQYWVKFNQCNATPVITNVPDIVTSDLCSAEHHVYQNGQQGSTVEFYKIIGGTHTWPGAFINVGVTNMDFSASKEIWRFFSQYSLNQFVTSIGQTKHDEQVQIYPNPSTGNFNLVLNDFHKSFVEIFALDGRLVQAVQLSQAITSFNLQATGMYVIRITTPQQRFQQSILVQ